jgi:MoxR-like ATPase
MATLGNGHLGDGAMRTQSGRPLLRESGTDGIAVPVLRGNARSPVEMRDAVLAASTWVQPLRDEIGRVIVGQRGLVDRLLVALLADGHVLLEGVPGLAKTLSLRTLAAAVQGRFQRIQFTPDMLPADVVGTLIYSPRDGSFVTKHGPIFANLVLADEINRAPAKVQSALLEAMQERQVTIGEETHPLPAPFVVMATQNPIEQEGTYPLPEAQVDRFLLKVVVGYPTKTEERAILDRMTGPEPAADVRPIVDGAAILAARHAVKELYVDDKVKDYIVDIVWATREPQGAKIDVAPYIKCGASPRATIALTLAAKAWAFLQGRAYVTPQDVKTIGMDVLRHRVTVNYEAEAENVSAEDVVTRIFDGIAVP